MMMYFLDERGPNDEFWHISHEEELYFEAHDVYVKASNPQGKWYQRYIKAFFSEEEAKGMLGQLLINTMEKCRRRYLSLGENCK